MSMLLTEASAAPTMVSDRRWRAVLITPGKGSSGVYTESALRNTGAKAFPKGTHSYVDHPSREGEIRSPKNLMGVLVEDARYEDGVGLVAEIEVMPHWKEFVEAVAPHTGLSIYAMGDASVNDDGEIVVEGLIPDTQNSVDLVSYPGRPGSKMADKLYESAVAAFSDNGNAGDEPVVTEEKMEEGNSMTLEEMKELLESALAPLVERVTAVEESLKPAEEELKEEEINVEAVAEAMVEAELPAVSRKAVYEALRNGADLAEAIEGQKAFVESVKAHLAETQAPVAEKPAEVIVEEAAAPAARLTDILNVKVGA